MAALPNPVAVASVPGPNPTATLPTELVQSELLPAVVNDATPLIDAQVPLAVPAPASDAAANPATPDASAASRTPPATLSFDVAVCLPIQVHPFHGSV